MIVTVLSTLLLITLICYTITIIRLEQRHPNDAPSVIRFAVERVSDGKCPSYSRPGDACLDLFARVSQTMILEPNETVKIPVGVKMAITPGYEGQIRPRSGGSSRGMLVHFGTIDHTYRGEIMVIITNISHGLLTIENKEKIAQMAVRSTVEVQLEEKELGPPTIRGENGFGSSGQF